MTNVIRCEHVSIAFDGIQALADIDVQFPSSGIIAIIGPNGAGKSTLVNVLTGFAHPDAGNCYLGDREITRLAPNRIAKLGVARTFQDVRLIRSISVVDNMLLARPNQLGEKLLPALSRIRVAEQEVQNRAAAMRYLAVVGLEAKALNDAEELSYGQQKLLTFGCCLATECPVLILDEPVAGLDPEMTTKIMDLLRLVAERQKLVIFIEHNLDVVRRTANYVIVMDGGRIIAQGEADEVLKLPEVLEAYIA